MSNLKLDTLLNVAGTKSVPVNTVIDGSAKAWVNFNGTGTVSIRKAFNVSSITDAGTGNFLVNFINPFPDSDYVAVATSGGDAGSGSTETSIFTAFGAGGTDPTTTAIRLRCTNAAGSVLGDPDRVCLVIFD